MVEFEAKLSFNVRILVEKALRFLLKAFADACVTGEALLKARTEAKI